MACSTALPGAIAVIRISGPDAKKLLDKCFECKTPAEDKRLRVGILNTERIKDTATAVYFAAPKTYTGEDMAEIYTHGSVAVVESAIKFLIENGARAAEGGEFTKRAYLNGKMDLSAAEGVINLINSQTEREANAAFMMVTGGLRAEIEKLQKEIQSAAAGTEAAIDYPEEGIEEETKQQLYLRLEKITAELSKIKNSYGRGRLIKNGVRVALTGRVNAGKSQLANALLNKDMAIVTDIPGTTRDTLRDFYEYKGYRFVVADTAGIRQTEDAIEKIGIDRAINAIADSDVVLAVFEHGEKFDQDILGLIKQKTGHNLDTDKIIYVENKIDLACGESFPNLQNLENAAKQENVLSVVKVSALKNTGIEELKEAILRKAQVMGSDGLVLTELRHFHAFCRAGAALSDALAWLNSATMDCIAADLLSAYNALGEITGLVGTDDIISEIFSRFCVGK